MRSKFVACRLTKRYILDVFPMPFLQSGSSSGGETQRGNVQLAMESLTLQSSKSSARFPKSVAIRLSLAHFTATDDTVLAWPACHLDDVTPSKLSTRDAEHLQSDGV